MSSPTDPSQPLVAFTVSPRIRHFLALLFRVGLGFSFLNTGLIGYQLQSSPGMMNGRFPGNGMAPGMGLIGGTEVFQIALPYLQMGVGLALILGFMTTVAAGMAGLLTIFQPLLQTLSLLLTVSNGNRMDPFAFQLQSLLGQNQTLTLVQVAFVLCLSSVKINSWSLDGLMFGRARGGTPSSGVSKPTPPMLQQGMADDPAARFETRLRSGFDPDRLDESNIR